MRLPTINPGDFPHLVRIMRESFDPSVVSRTQPLVLFAESWAKIDNPSKPKIGSNIQGQDTSELLTEISIPYIEGVSSNMRIVLGNNQFLIQDVTNYLMMNVVLVLTCTMIGANTQ